MCLCLRVSVAGRECMWLREYCILTEHFVCHSHGVIYSACWNLKSPIHLSLGHHLFHSAPWQNISLTVLQAFSHKTPCTMRGVIWMWARTLQDDVIVWGLMGGSWGALDVQLWWHHWENVIGLFRTAAEFLHTDSLHMDWTAQLLLSNSLSGN